jgi:hypothetical protein
MCQWKKSNQIAHQSAFGAQMFPDLGLMRADLARQWRNLAADSATCPHVIAIVPTAWRVDSMPFDHAMQSD